MLQIIVVSNVKKVLRLGKLELANYLPNSWNTLNASSFRNEAQSDAVVIFIISIVWFESVAIFLY